MGRLPQLLALGIILLVISSTGTTAKKSKKKAPVAVTSKPFIKKFDTSGIEYCDKERYENPLKASCGVGYTFERLHPLPKCVCIQGIYRIFLDNCEIADGFIRGRSCTLPYDSTNGARMHSMQLIPEPRWDLTHVVYEKKSTPGVVPNAFDIVTFTPGLEIDKKKKKKVSVLTDTDTFYTINGRAKVVTRHSRQYICIETSYKEEQQICHYFKSENSDVWIGNPNSDNASTFNNTIEIVVQDDCGKVQNNTKTNLLVQSLIPQECFAPLTEKQAECSLECDKEDEDVNEDLLESRSKKEGENCTDLEASIKHDNDFLDRKISGYALVSQIKDIPPLRPIQPNRTFDLFDRLIKISNQYCDDHYVPNHFVNHVTEMFYVMHKGREFHYVETLSDLEHKWIQDILDRCLAEEYTIDLINDKDVYPGMIDYNGDWNCSGDTEQAGGYCNLTLQDTHVCPDKAKVEIDPSPGSAGANLKNKHYVPELAWNMLDLVQAVCFREFNDSYRMFHVLQQAVEKLFTIQIRNIWHYPTYTTKPEQVPGDRIEKLLGVSAHQIMYNMDICVSSAYHKEVKGMLPRLKRIPKYPIDRYRKKRSVAPRRLSYKKKQKVSPVCLGPRSRLNIPFVCTQPAVIQQKPVNPSESQSKPIPGNLPIQPDHDPDYDGNYDPEHTDIKTEARVRQMVNQHSQHQNAAGKPEASRGSSDYVDMAVPTMGR